MHPPLIILGAQTRPAAASARRAGYEPWCIDRLVSEDLRELAAARACPPGGFPDRMLDILRHAEDAPDAPVLLTAPLEDYPRFLDRLAAMRPLLGSQPAAITAARSLEALNLLPRIAALRPVLIRHSAPLWMRLLRGLLPNRISRRYLVHDLPATGEPREAEGEQPRIHVWGLNQRLRRGQVLIERIEGRPFTAAFATDGWSALLLGVVERLLGGPARGCAPLQEGGAIGPITLTEPQRLALGKAGAALAQRLDLRGLFAIDGVLDERGLVRPTALVPRYVAAIDLIERATAAAALNAPPLRHGRDAVPRAPAPPPASASGEPAAVWGMAHVRDRLDRMVPDLQQALEPGHLADIPPACTPIPARRAICTVLVEADGVEACRKILAERCERVLQFVEARAPRV